MVVGGRYTSNASPLTMHECCLRRKLDCGTVEA